MRVTHLNPHEAHELISSSGEVTILDVRTPKEFEMSYIEGALNFAFTIIQHDDMFGFRKEQPAFEHEPDAARKSRCNDKDHA